MAQIDAEFPDRPGRDPRHQAMDHFIVRTGLVRSHFLHHLIADLLRRTVGGALGKIDKFPDASLRILGDLSDIAVNDPRQYSSCDPFLIHGANYKMRSSK